MDVSKLAKKRAKRDLIIVPPKHEDDSNEDMRKREKALAIYGRHYEAPSLMVDPPEEKPVHSLENAGDELDANKAKKLVLKKVRMALMSDDGGTEDLELQR